MPDNFNELQQETLKEIAATLLGSAGAAVFSQLTSRKVTLAMPELSFFSQEKLREEPEFKETTITVEVDCNDDLLGKSILFIDIKDAFVISQLMMMQDPAAEEKITAIHLSALGEAMSQLTGTAATALSEKFERPVNISPPQLEESTVVDSVEKIFPDNKGGFFLLSFRLNIEGLLDSGIIQLIPYDFSLAMVSFILKDQLKELGEENEADFSPSFEGELAHLEKDTLMEIGNISMGSSATSLAQLISHQVNISTPRLSYTTMEEVRVRYPRPCVIVEIGYVEGLVGKNLFIIEAKDAIVIGQLMMMEEPDDQAEINEIHISAVGEAMNQMMGAAATSMSEIFKRNTNISPPVVEYKEIVASDKEKEGFFVGQEEIVQVSFRMQVEGLIDSNLIQLIPLKFAKEMTAYLLGGYQEEGLVSDFLEDSSEEEKVSLSAENFAESVPEAQAEKTRTVSAPSSTMREKILLPDLDDNFALVKDISIEIIGVLGHVKKSLTEVLQLDKGSLIEFDKYVGEPVDILANGKIVARADIVEVNERYGLKLREIISE